MELKSLGQEEETEAKVQVDRRKLEAMITGEAPGETAEVFFARVEKDTGAKIYWPSKLKIRAKTKKDPFVKVIGKAQSVQRAAQAIEEKLRTKKERVILKVEVCHSLHSQIIGKGGRNTQQIMRETNCHIHFPDSNKSCSNPTTPMNDQVSISGCAKDVETAREMIRAICPLTVAVTIQLGAGRNLYAIQPRLDPTQLQRHFPCGGDLSVQFVSQCPPLMGTLHFLMRSSARNELEMLRAFGKVCQLIGVFPSGAELHFDSQFELRPAALPSLGAVRWIAFRTNTQIQLNQQGLLISGPLEGIFIARKLLTGLLPVSLHFEKCSELCSQCPSTSAMETELDIQIGERRRRKGAKGTRETAADEKDFVVATYEANLFGAYTARNRLLKIKEPVKDQFPQDSESAAFMRSVCRESLMADQQQPLIAAAASVAFSNSAHLSFGQKESVGWKESKREVGTDQLEKCRESGEQPKSPDPQKSPIAAGVLAGVKSVHSRKMAVCGGFSSSLPVDLLRLGRAGGEWPAEGQWRRGRPIVGRGADEAKDGGRPQKNGANCPNWHDQNGPNWHNGRRTADRRQTPFGRSMDHSAALSLRAPFGSSLAFFNPRGSSPLVVLHEMAKESEEGKNQSSDESETTKGETETEMGPNNGTPKVHPRVAALQMADQQRASQKFAMSAGGLSADHSFRTASTSGNCCTGKALDPQQSAGENGPPPRMGAERALQNWDIRSAGEPAEVLAQLGLAEHIAPFREQEIDMQAFLLLDEQCLVSLGVATIGARRKLLHAIRSELGRSAVATPRPLRTPPLGAMPRNVFAVTGGPSVRFALWSAFAFCCFLFL